MISSRHLAVGIASAALLLSSTPAFAFSLGVGDTARNNRHMDVHQESSVSAQNDKENDRDNSDRFEDQDSQHSGTGSMKSGSGSMKFHGQIKEGNNPSPKALAKMKANFQKSLAHSLTKMVSVSERICSENNSTSSAMMSCMNTAKTELKASINAMIDASFGTGN